MSDLPSARVGQTKPFQCIRVDYGAPFYNFLNKFSGTKSHKAYMNRRFPHCINCFFVFLDEVTALITLGHSNITNIILA